MIAPSTTAPAGDDPGSSQDRPSDGHLDQYGYIEDAGSLVLAGWISSRWIDPIGVCAVELDVGGATLEGAAVGGDARFCLYRRDDVHEIGHGLVVVLATGADIADAIAAVTLRSREGSFRLSASHTVARVSDAEIAAQGRHALSGAPSGTVKAELVRILSRAAFSGVDTFAGLALPVYLELDAVYLCPPAGLMLRGWWADPFRQIERVRLRSGRSSRLVDLEACAQQPRCDVVEAFRQRGILFDRATGFLAFLPDGAWQHGADSYLELRTGSGEVGYKPLPAPTGVGIASIQEILGSFEADGDRLDSLFDETVGPALQAMNAYRLADLPKERVRRFGAAPPDPVCSLIIPLHGRIDFLEYQCALIARGLSGQHEIIFVLDDPSLERAAATLAASCFARFDTPFTLVSLSHTVGYAPANNIGLRHARGEFTCFLNSDVFPQAPGWLDHLIETSRADSHVGVVGARLLFEDGTIQHDGCVREVSPEHAGWHFIAHPGKGRRPPDAASVEVVDAVTGACLLLRTSLARDLGGFDPAYIIGDFEDFDLCLRVRALGLHCVIDRRAVLYHLERQSQGDQARRWRCNLTLLNAWRFNRAWR